MLQNVVRYLVQNIVVHSCVNVVRHVICCHYFCFGERKTWLLSRGCPLDAAAHYSTALLLSWDGFCLIHRAASVVLFNEWDPCSLCCCLISGMFVQVKEEAIQNSIWFCLLVQINCQRSVACTFWKCVVSDDGFCWLWLRECIKICLAEYTQLTVSWGLPCHFLWKKDRDEYGSRFTVMG